MSISLRIKELIKEKKLSQKELAAVLMIDASQFSKIVNGKLQPTLSQLMEISSFFKVSLDWLCFGKIDIVIQNQTNYKELADSRLETISLLKEKVAKLNNEVIELTENKGYGTSVHRGTVEFLNEPKLGGISGKKG